MRNILSCLLVLLFILPVLGQGKLMSEEELTPYMTYRKLGKNPVDSVFKITIENMGAVPDDFDKWSRLQRLCIFGNDWDYELFTLPAYFFTFPNLTHLTITNTDLTSLSPAVKNFTHLQSLNVASNQLTALPKTLNLCTELKSLTIDNNIDKIPELPSLEEISIYFETNLGSDSGLIPAGIADLSHLKAMYLNGENTLVNLPELIRIFKTLPALEKLSLMDPNLTEQDIKALSGIKKLDELNLPSIETAPAVMQGFAHLQRISFGKYLSKDPAKRSQFWQALISSPKLEEVSTTLVIADTQYYRQLKRINLVMNSDNSMEEQFGAIQNLPNLYRLELPRATHVPRNLADVQNVKVIDITELYGIDPSFVFGYMMLIPGLEKIILSNDQLTIFPMEITKMPRLKEMEIYNIQHGTFNIIPETEKIRAQKLMPDCHFRYIERF